MSCKTGNLTNCLNECDSCADATMQNYDDRNDQCMNVCGSRLKHGFTKVKSLCKCAPRTHIIPCDTGSEFERKKCYLENGYQYWDEECVVKGDNGRIPKPSPAPSNKPVNKAMNEQITIPKLPLSKENFSKELRFTANTKLADLQTNDIDTTTGGDLNGKTLDGLYSNDNNLVGCDYTFPYDNNIKLLYQTPWRGDLHDVWRNSEGGYIKFDKLTNDIVHISMNPRQGGDDIAKVGILRTPAVNPLFKAENLTCSDLNVSIKLAKQTNFSPDDALLQSKLKNRVVHVQKKDVNLVFDFFTCQYGYMRLVDNDFELGTHKYYVFGLGPISKDTDSNFSLNWADYKRRCNQNFGTTQQINIYGSHWPIMYVLRTNNRTGEQKCFSVFFDHFRKVEYFFDDLQTKGIIKIRTREPEFRFYVSIDDTILLLRKQFMKIVGSPQPPVKKAMGLWIQRFGYRNWDEVNADIKLIRDSKFPLDGFIFDLYWYGHQFPVSRELNENSYADNFCHQKSAVTLGNQMGIFQWDDVNFPKHQENAQQLMKNYKYGLTLIEEPFLSADSEDFSMMLFSNMVAKLQNGSFAQPEGVWQDWVGEHAAMPDFTNPETSKHWFKTRILPNITDGTYFWWNDLSEPEIFNENALYLGIGQVDDDGIMKHEMHQAPDVLNFNQLLWSKGISEEYNSKLNKRYNVLLRSGTCGIQRYGAFMWPGDTKPTLLQMNVQTNSLANLSLVGLDFSASDAGGFFTPDTNAPEERQKLYSLWYANSAATNFSLKPHKYIGPGQSTSSPTEWGSVEDNLANTIDRYLLSPYYYSYAMDISTFGDKQGEPFTTTLFFKYQSDPLLLQDALENRTNSLNLFVGPSLLYVMLKAYNETSRNIYLPADTMWYNYRNLTWIKGGEVYTTEFKSINICPLFIKNNSIIPMRTKSDIKNSLNMRFDDVIYKYDVFIYSYDGLNADPFTLYIDDGISMNKNQTKIIIMYKNGQPIVKLVGTSCSFPSFNFVLVSKDGITILESFQKTKENFKQKNPLKIKNKSKEKFTLDLPKNFYKSLSIVVAGAFIGFLLSKQQHYSSHRSEILNQNLFVIFGILVSLLISHFLL